MHGPDGPNPWRTRIGLRPRAAEVHPPKLDHVAHSQDNSVCLSRESIRTYAFLHSPTEILHAKVLSSCGALPITSLLNRPVDFDRTTRWAFIHAAAAIPTLLRMQDDRSFASIGIRNEYIDGTHFYTIIAASTDDTIDDHGPIGSRYIGNCVYLF